MGKYGLRARGKKNGNNANGKKRERKEGDKTVISHKITDWGKYIIFFSPQLGQRKKNIPFFLQVRTHGERE